MNNMNNIYYFQKPEAVNGELYFYGGYNSIDRGVPDWGANNEHDSLLVGDTAGNLVIEYQNSSVQMVPLIFGYTMWWRERWNDAMAPFKGDGAVPKYAEVLQRTLALYGAFEGVETCVLKVKVKKEPIKSIYVKNNPLKMGIPVFHKVESACNDPEAQKFFETHTVCAEDPTPKEVLQGINELFTILYHTEDELKEILPSEAPKDFVSQDIRFYGCYEAEILTNVYRDNCYDMHAKVDDDYAFNASSPGSYCWGRYDGFGTWITGTANFYGNVYSRDGGRSVMSMIDTGYLDTAGHIIDYLNEKLMYFPESYPKLTFGGMKIPGHWTVIVNKPLIYSTYLSTVGWPTRYTEERFGKEYQNLGNLETDGHGLTMMSTYKYFLSSGRRPEYVKKNWTYIKEAAEFIIWCIEHPELTFTEDDVLYGETEAAMNDHTLYANIPCCMGMLFYSEMAEAAGEKEYAAKWKEYHNRMVAGIDRRFTKKEDKKEYWDLEHCGFYHDPVLTMLGDIYGYDIAKFPYPNWVKRSVNSYQVDLNRYVKDTYAAPRGIGYDFNMITQNAILLDNTYDYTQFVNHLAKLCYAPKFHGRYLVPEGATVLTDRKIYRREGDLGNMVQQGETLKTILMLCGLYEEQDGTIQMLPRMPKKYNLYAKKIHVINSAQVTVDLHVKFMEHTEYVTVRLENTRPGQKAFFRAGPFSTAYVTLVTADNQRLDKVAEKAGDAYWLPVPVPDQAFEEEISFHITEQNV